MGSAEVRWQVVDATTGEPAPLPTRRGFSTEGAARIFHATLLRGESRWTVRPVSERLSY